MIIPWQVDVPQDRYPFMNWLLVASIIGAFALQSTSIREREDRLPAKIAEYEKRSVEDVAKDLGAEEKRLKEIERSADKISRRFEKITSQKDGSSEFKDALIKRTLLEEYFVWGKIRHFVLHGWNIAGLFGHIWLHGGWMHLLGNLLFLWIFGNAVCAKIGNMKYLPIFAGLGAIAAASHLIFNGGPMIGASGAINGIVGMFLVLFPTNDITCYLVLWIFIFFKTWEFTLSSYWMILFWFAFDLLGALFLSGMGGVAYFAHVGGFLAGVALAIVLLKTKIVVMEPRYEKSLLQAIDEWRKPPQSPSDNRYNDFQRTLEYGRPEEAEPPPPITLPPAINFFDITGETEKPQTNAAPPPDSIKRPVPNAGAAGIELPAPELIRFVCTCGQKVKIPAKFAGKTGRCPACKKQIKIPFPD